jgi:hypothetical protein
VFPFLSTWSDLEFCSGYTASDVAVLSNSAWLPETINGEQWHVLESKTNDELRIKFGYKDN